ncbi:hypothetical protein [Novosphingobium soli]|uniref:DUF1049 domain-containing protein n=1 Tax=Novosphingobium soli TaxID=574956 RepID=A0ABV6CVF3_9SPHN
MKRIAVMLAIALVAFTAHAWTPLLLESPDVRAFVLSDLFWPAMFGGAFAISSICAAAAAAILFHPDRLSGRTGRERGE